jgi:NAD(P)-dependent dehydrogenase (short-subunit alcohol dehydrogenase family)
VDCGVTIDDIGGPGDQRLLESVQTEAMRRAGEPEEFASVVDLLVSDEASFVTCTTIEISWRHLIDQRQTRQRSVGFA